MNQTFYPTCTTAAIVIKKCLNSLELSIHHPSCPRFDAEVQRFLFCSILHFVNQFQKKQTPDDIEEVELTIASSSIALPNLLKDSGMLKSTSEAMRLIKQGAVKIDEQKIEDPKFQVEKGTNQTYQVGKRNFKKINVT